MKRGGGDPVLLSELSSPKEVPRVVPQIRRLSSPNHLFRLQPTTFRQQECQGLLSRGGKCPRRVGIGKGRKLRRL
jgi:hypothetical protein